MTYPYYTLRGPRDFLQRQIAFETQPDQQPFPARKPRHPPREGRAGLLERSPGLGVWRVGGDLQHQGLILPRAGGPDRPGPPDGQEPPLTLGQSPLHARGGFGEPIERQAWKPLF